MFIASAQNFPVHLLLQKNLQHLLSTNQISNCKLIMYVIYELFFLYKLWGVAKILVKLKINLK